MEPGAKLQSIKEFRRARIAALLDEHGKTELSRLVDISADYLWQMGKGQGASGRGVSDANAAKIEAALGKPAGWMDGDEGAPQSHSQSMRLDPEIIRDIAEALDERYALDGGFDLAERAHEFARAYEIWTGMSDASEPKTLKLVIRHADLSPQGASINGQAGKEAPPDDASGARVRTGGRRRKAQAASGGRR